MLEQLDRRHFLLGTAAAVATTPAWAKHLAKGPKALSESGFRSLSDIIDGFVLRPGDADYPSAALPNNLRYAAIRPQAIAQCTSTDDVRAVLQWCRDNEFAFATRSGGHSYAGFSTTDGILIDMADINESAIDGDVVKIGGGSVNSDVYAALKCANRSMTHGRCPSVGAAPFLLGGGIGFNMREFGMACDQVTKIEIVLADGTVKTVSEASTDKDDRDLFWACRGGGGGNFGIATAFWIKTHATEPVTVFRMVWENANEDLARTLLGELNKGPDKLGSRVSLQAGENDSVTIDLLGQLKGSEDELRGILKDTYRTAKPTLERIRNSVEYWKGQAFLHEEGHPTFYQERSGYAVQADVGKLVETGFAHLRNAPPTRNTRDLRFFQTGGQINAVDPDKTAYVHRKSDWLCVVGLYWTTEDDANRELIRRAHRWQDDFYRAVKPLLKGSYQNFPDPTLTREESHRDYYGDNYPELLRIRKTVDRDGAFNFAQGI